MHSGLGGWMIAAHISQEAAMQFYTYWRSLASFRVRIALAHKGIAATTRIVDLTAGHQMRPEFKAINPQMALPALVLDDGTVLFQSMAIMEYLDEVYPEPALLPADPAGRARVRALAQIPVSDGHPLVVPRVRHYLEHRLAVDEAARTQWSRHWMGAALSALEGHLAQPSAAGLTSTYCHGDRVTLADICLVSQVVGYGFFGGSVAEFPTVARIHARCMELDAFANAHPSKQPEAPKA